MDQSLSPRFRVRRRPAVLLLPAVLSGAAVSTQALATNVETPRIVLTPEVSHGDVTVSIASSVDGIQGWSFGLCHDPEQARIARFDPSDELAVINGGEPPYFYKCELASLVDGDGRRVEGLIQAVV